MHDLPPPPALGTRLADVETPALIVDLPTFDANVAAMAQTITGSGKQWRPHAKCHKSPHVAARQREAGAIGSTVANIVEAEVLASGGTSDLLIAHCLVSPGKLERIARLCKTANPIVTCDHFAQAEMLSTACRQQGVVCRVVVDINIGLNRTGIRPGPDAYQLAAGIATLPGVKLVGLFGYEGHLLTIAESDKKRSSLNNAMAILTDLHSELTQQGFDLPIITAGGTGSYQLTVDHPGLTEIQAGGGCFADPFYTQMCGVTGLSPSLSVLASVVSRPKLERGILDAGRKSINPDHVPPDVYRQVDGPELPDAEITLLSAEHATLELGPTSRNLRIGDKVLLRPGYSDLTTLLHRQFVCVADSRVVDIWPIVAR